MQLILCVVAILEGIVYIIGLVCLCDSDVHVLVQVNSFVFVLLFYKTLIICNSFHGRLILSVLTAPRTSSILLLSRTWIFLISARRRNRSPFSLIHTPCSFFCLSFNSSICLSMWLSLVVSVSLWKWKSRKKQTINYKCLTYFYAKSNKRIFFKIEFLFHEDSQYTDVWKYCGVYKYCAVCLNIDYTLICLEYICSVSSPLKRHGLSWRHWQMFS